MSYQEQQEAIKNKVVGVVNDVADRASTVADTASRQGSAAKKELYRTANDVAGRAVDALNDAGLDTDQLQKTFGSTLDAIAKNIRSTVKERPLGAIAVTAAIGLILGAMASR